MFVTTTYLPFIFYYVILVTCFKHIITWQDILEDTKSCKAPSLLCHQHHCATCMYKHLNLHKFILHLCISIHVSCTSLSSICTSLYPAHPCPSLVRHSTSLFVQANSLHIIHLCKLVPCKSVQVRTMHTFFCTHGTNTYPAHLPLYMHISYITHF